MSRPAQASVDLDALRHNYLLTRRLHGGRTLAVLKADAYGHGAAACARALEAVADGFAVAFLAEAIALREAGIRAPILVLEGAFSAAEYTDIARHQLWTVVHHTEQLRMLERAALGCAHLNVWLKIDTGMHRAGVPAADAKRMYACLLETGRVASITLMSHFSRADETAAEATRAQIAAFDAATDGLPGPRSLANSAGLLAWPAARRDWGRPGIALYGVDPTGAAELDLRPVMTLTSAVFAERTLDPGEAMGYGGTFVAERATRVGLVAMGYGDGYPSRAPTGTPVAIDGRLSRVLGRVSMDMMAIDLTDLPGAGIGSAVELWGTQVSVGEVAARAGVLSYELLCHVRRVPIRYVEARRALAHTGT